MEQLESKEQVHKAQLASQVEATKKAHEQNAILSAQVKKLEHQSAKDREIIQLQKIRIDNTETLFNKTIQSIGNCCRPEPLTTKIIVPESTTWTIKRNLTGHSDQVLSLVISKENLLISRLDYKGLGH